MITASVLLFAHAGGVLAERESQMICQAELAEAQKKAGQSIEQLLALNGPIRLWKGMRKTALIILSAGSMTVNPAALELARRQYQLSIRMLDFYRLRQKALLIEGSQHLQKGLREAKSLIKESWQRQQQAQGQLLQSLRGQFDGSSLPLLAVRRADVQDTYPEYELRQPFSILQAQSLSWKIHYGITKDKQTWTKITASKWNNLTWSKPQNCQVTLQEREKNSQTFRVRLNEDKFFLRRWF
ncbi:MAG: hypothetical protein ACK5P7_10075 [Bdellovibrio sp.]